jgi:hypothetical protein
MFLRSDIYIDTIHIAFGGHDTLFAVVPIDTTRSHTGILLALLGFYYLSMLNKYMGIRKTKLKKNSVYIHMEQTILILYFII